MSMALFQYTCTECNGGQQERDIQNLKKMGIATDVQKGKSQQNRKMGNTSFLFLKWL